MRTTSLLALLLLGFTLSTASAAQDGPPILTSPRYPLDTVPTWALLEVRMLFTLIDEEAMVRRHGQTLRLDVQGFNCGPVYCSYSAFPVELGLLEAGTYRVETWVAGEYSGSTLLEVGMGPRLSISPAVPTEEDAVTLHLKGSFGPCPSAEGILLSGNTLTVEIRQGNCATSPTQDELEVELPPKAAGDYSIEVLQNGQPAAYFNYTVLPARAKLQNGRFELTATWRDALGQSGTARLVQAPSNDSALFYFFSADNWELMVKVLDGCAINGAYWVFAAASTDVEYSVTIEDLENPGMPFSFGNRLGQPAAAITHLDVFPCPSEVAP